jgi:predicted ABC-type ATPase
MYIVAGPPGSGKSEAFKVKDFGVEFFNADDRAAELNGGSYHKIPLEIRTKANREFESFIESHIEQRMSFALETTLRTAVAFDQTRRAHARGFVVKMLYVALADVEINLQRIKTRAKLGFHSAPSALLRDIHARSLQNLGVAILECGVSVDELAIYDNSAFNRPPRLLAEIERGRMIYLADSIPQWLGDALPDGRIPEI